MSTQGNITIGRALLDSMAAHDLSQWEALLAEDFTCSYPGFRGEYGKEAAKAYNMPLIAAFPDLRFDILRTMTNGDTVIYVWNGKGTHSGPLALPTETVPPTGKYAELQGVLVTTMKDGKILREESYWNQMELLAQLGLMRA
jgi:steroid delta-isomerase-like uncharacterized protein